MRQKIQIDSHLSPEHHERKYCTVLSDDGLKESESCCTVVPILYVQQKFHAYIIMIIMRTTKRAMKLQAIGRIWIRDLMRVTSLTKA